MKTIEVPEKALYILDKLNQEGYEAFIVGGCVRDALLGRSPQDWDITTSALPGDLKRIFKRTIDTGIQHGTVTLMIGREGFEVTTYRIDGHYSDGRHPENVTFTADLKEDLSRRDFTINAMAYHPKVGLVDEFGGVRDLKEGLIRCVGNPLERFTEDALRILRALRFAAQLNFSVEAETKEAVRRLCKNLAKISAERIHMELDKLITSDNPGRLREAYEAGITKVILPEFDKMMETPQNNPHHCFNVGEHCIRALECLKRPYGIDEKMYSCLCWVMLLHDVGKPEVKFTDEEGVDHFHRHNEAGVEIAKKILKRLKFDNESARFICNMVYYHDYRFKFESSHATRFESSSAMKSVRKAASKIGSEDMACLFLVQKADIMAQSRWKREEKLSSLEKMEDIYWQIIKEKQCLYIKDLKVNGKDLMELGIPKGPMVGKILKELLEFVLDDEKNNEKDILLKKAGELKSLKDS